MKTFPIAIIGSGCINAPDGYDVGKYWENILSGKSGVMEIPPDRWDHGLYYDNDRSAPGKTYCKHGAYVVDYSAPDRLGLSQNTKESLNRSQLFIIDAIDQAVRQSGLDLNDIPDNRIGFCLANMLGDEILHRYSLRYHAKEVLALMEKSDIYQELSHLDQERLRASFMEGVARKFPTLQPGEYTKYSNSMMLKRVVDMLGKKRSLSWIYDAACAGSVASLRMAINNLRTDSLDYMVVTSLFSNMLSPGYVTFSKIGGLTDQDNVKPLDHKADGLVSGEGCGCFIMRRLHDAMRDGNKILGVIGATANTTDGVPKGIFAPSYQGQLRAMQRALDHADLTGYDVDYVETHATGTPTGDKEELVSLTKLFHAGKRQSSPVFLGSCKSQLGHSFSAAGAGNIIKLLKAFEYATLPPTHNFKKLTHSPQIDTSLFAVNTASRPWKRRNAETPLRAIVNAFGFGGVNSSMLLEEYLPQYHSKLIDMASASAISAHEVDIAVVGIGCLNGDMVSKDRFLDESIVKLSYQRSFPRNRWNPEVASMYTDDMPTDFKVNAIDKLEFNSAKYKIPPAAVSHFDRSQVMMLMAAEDALNDYGKEKIQAETTAVFVGGMLGGEAALTASLKIQRFEYLELLRNSGQLSSLPKNKERKFLDTLSSQIFSYVPEPTEDTLPGFMDNIIPGRIANRFQLKGSNGFVDNEAMSFATVLDFAVKGLVLKRHDTMLVGAVHANLMPEFLSIHRDLLQTRSEKRCPHCGQDYSRLIPAEGGVMFVLKRLEDVRPGDKVYARIKNVSYNRRASQSEFTQCCPLQNKPDTLFYFGANGAFAFLKSVLALSQNRYDLFPDSGKQSATAHDKSVCIISNSLFRDEAYYITINPTIAPKISEKAPAAPMEGWLSFYCGGQTDEEIANGIHAALAQLEMGGYNELASMKAADVRALPKRVSILYKSEDELRAKLLKLAASKGW